MSSLRHSYKFYFSGAGGLVVAPTGAKTHGSFILFFHFILDFLCQFVDFPSFKFKMNGLIQFYETSKKQKRAFNIKSSLQAQNTYNIETFQRKEVYPSLPIPVTAKH